MKPNEWIGRTVRVDTPDPKPGQRALPYFVKIDRIDPGNRLSGLDPVTGVRWTFDGPGGRLGLPPWCNLIAPDAHGGESDA